MIRGDTRPRPVIDKVISAVERQTVIERCGLIIGRVRGNWRTVTPNHPTTHGMPDKAEACSLYYAARA